LVPICKNPEDAVPSKEMTDALTALCTNPENTVWVVSGREQVLHKKEKRELDEN
jgi:trehalose 6-phosphate synthase/phosphatase